MVKNKQTETLTKGASSFSGTSEAFRNLRRSDGRLSDSDFQSQNHQSVFTWDLPPICQSLFSLIYTF